MKRSADRRSSRRVPTVGSALRAHLALEARILHLSASGMLVRLPFSPEIGSRHGFTLVLGGASADVFGLVRNTALQNEEDGLYDVGIEFVDLPPTAAGLLEKFVDQKLNPS